MHHPCSSFDMKGHVRALQIGDTLEEFLTEATDDAKLRQVVMSLSEAVRTIAFKVCPAPRVQLCASCQCGLGTSRAVPNRPQRGTWFGVLVLPAGVAAAKP